MQRRSFFALLLLLLVFSLWLTFGRRVRPAANTVVTATPNVSKAQIVGIVLPHHDLVRAQRQALLKEAAAKVTPETIVLISPNHFDAGQGGLITTDRTWQLTGGSYTANATLVKQLVATAGATLDDTAFNREHGITNVLPDLQAVWPQASIVPLMVRPGFNQAAVDKLRDALNTACPRCLVVASVDFSHYQPAALADVHDVATIRSLTAADEKTIWQAEVDSPPSLAFLVGWANLHQASKFFLHNHTNSGTIANNPEVETTTHVFGWYESGAAAVPAVTRTFLFGGDVMLGRDIAARYQADQFAELWQNLGERTFWGVDLSIVNFEGPIADTATVPALDPNNLHFIFPQTSAHWLATQHVLFAGLANNHSGTFGDARLAATRGYLEAAGVTPVGDPNMTQEFLVPSPGPGELPLGIVPINTLSDDGSQVAAAIKRLKDQGAFVIVFPHWGDEYRTSHTSLQEAQARQWLAAGADMIIGSHPHVVEDVQVIAGHLVVYSLGNLTFDQYFSVPTQRGLLVGGEITPTETKLLFLPVVIKAGRPELAVGDERKRLLGALCAGLSDKELVDNCTTGVFLIKHP